MMRTKTTKIELSMQTIAMAEEELGVKNTIISMNNLDGNSNISTLPLKQ